MRVLLSRLFVISFLVGMTSLSYGQFLVGVARKNITPKDSPVWLGGYASRNKPATGVSTNLWAKAIVIKDNRQKIAVIVTMDAHKLSREITEDVVSRIRTKHGLERSQIMFNVSHTHGGPMIWPNADMLELNPSDQQAIFLYSRKLADDLVEVVDLAMKDQKPAKIMSGKGSADFAKNRRDKNLLYHPVDNDVPVLKIETTDGMIMAVIFGYACHNTTLPGNNYEVNGDYAGYAQSEIENLLPGTTAMFVQGCAGDINPASTGTIEKAVQNGKFLADAVHNVLTNKMVLVEPPIRTAYKEIELEFQEFNLDQFQKDILSKDKYVQRRARLMLLNYNNDFDMSKFSYPIQAIRFNNDLTILALGGESTVDYSLMVKKDFHKENLFMAGYCNEIICYIPTKRLLEEGGYEPSGSMVYYVLPGSFKPNVEKKVLDGIDYVMKNVRARK